MYKLNVYVFHHEVLNNTKLNLLHTKFYDILLKTKFFRID